MSTLDNQKDVMALMQESHMQSLFEESGIVKNKKWAYIFDDVLVHDVCWSSQCN
jgi:hypothetical protein